MDRLEYTIINEGAGFALYRKLFPGEEIWYMDELHRLKKDREDIWLRLKSNNDKEVLESVRYGLIIKNINTCYEQFDLL